MKLVTTFFFLGIVACGIAALAQTQTPTPSQTASAAVLPATATAPGQVPQSVSSEIWKILGIISGYNVLMSAVQTLFSKAAKPTAAQLQGVAGAALSAAVSTAEAQAAPTLTAAQGVATGVLQIAKALSANPSV